MKTDVAAMLAEKTKHYGEKGGFFDTNSRTDYAHAIGETKLKLSEFNRVNEDIKFRRRLLVKALTWIYLIYETELGYGPEQDRTRG